MNIMCESFTLNFMADKTFEGENLFQLWNANHKNINCPRSYKQSLCIFDRGFSNSEQPGQ